VSLGFQPDRLLTFQLSLPRTKYPVDKSIAFYHQLLETLRATPGVRAAAAIERHSVRQRRLYDDADRDHRPVAASSGQRRAHRLARGHAGGSSRR